jgi:hypothetical protein
MFIIRCWDVSYQVLGCLSPDVGMFAAIAHNVKCLFRNIQLLVLKTDCPSMPKCTPHPEENVSIAISKVALRSYHDNNND